MSEELTIEKAREIVERRKRLPVSITLWGCDDIAKTYRAEGFLEAHSHLSESLRLAREEVERLNRLVDHKCKWNEDTVAIYQHRLKEKDAELASLRAEVEKRKAMSLIDAQRESNWLLENASLSAALTQEREAGKAARAIANEMLAIYRAFLVSMNPMLDKYVPAKPTPNQEEGKPYPSKSGAHHPACLYAEGVCTCETEANR